MNLFLVFVTIDIAKLLLEVCHVIAEVLGVYSKDEKHPQFL